MKVQTFIGGVAILFIAGVVAKILGAIFRIPLTWVLGAEGLGVYQLIYPVFALLIVLSSSGMPTAISKMVAERQQNGDSLNARKIFRVSLGVMSVVGLVFSALLVIFAGEIASLQGNSLGALGYIGIAPAVFFVSILSAFRGYFQGCSNMTPTALSQIIEQGAKLIFGLLFSYLLIDKGIEYGTFGALLGVTVSEILAVFILAIIYLKDKKKQDKTTLHSTLHSIKYSQILRDLIKTALPIVTASITLPLLVMIDSFMVVNLLLSAGFNELEATKMWGIDSGVVNSLINMPIALTLAVAISIVPSVANLKDKEKVRERLGQANFLVILFCLPIVVAFVTTPQNLMQFLYSESLGGQNYTNLASSLLICSSPIILLGALLQVQNSSLQGLGYGKITMLNMLLAGGLKIGLTFLLVTIPEINIFGCVISSLAFYGFAFLANQIFIRKKLGYRFSFKRALPSVLGSVGVGLTLLNFSLLNISIYIMLPLAYITAGIVYIFALWVFGVDFSEIKRFRLRRMKRVYTE